MGSIPKPFDLNAKFRNGLRSISGGYPQGYECQFCKENFHAGPKLWTHAKQVHQESLDAMGLAENAEAKRQFLGRAYVSF